MGARRGIATLAVLAAVLVPAAYASADPPLGPPAPVFSATPPSPSNDTSPTWEWQDSLGATGYECSLQPLGELPTWHDCTSPHDGDLNGLPDGDYEFRVHGTLAGVAGEDASDTYTLD